MELGMSWEVRYLRRKQICVREKQIACVQVACSPNFLTEADGRTQGKNQLNPFSWTRKMTRGDLKVGKYEGTSCRQYSMIGLFFHFVARASCTNSAQEGTSIIWKNTFPQFVPRTQTMVPSTRFSQKCVVYWKVLCLRSQWQGLDPSCVGMFKDRVLFTTTTPFLTWQKHCCRSADNRIIQA